MAFGQAWGEFPVVAGGEAAAEHAGDGNKIARARARTGECAFARGAAKQGERGDEAAAMGGEVAADQGHAVLAGEGGQTAIKRLQPVEPGARVEGEGDDGGLGVSAHGGDVREVAREEFPADCAGRDGVVEMLAVDDGIDGEQRGAVAMFGRGREHGAIVAHAMGRGGHGGAEPAADFGQELLFAERDDGQGRVVRKRMHVLRRGNRPEAVRWCAG
ncbi:MAG: hypothetical protein NTU80_07725 [Verrucomicrobia bacterium]|nr:hypothetical protein [Verrucomicrobiota bacterium]